MKKKPTTKDAGLLSSAQLCKLTGYKQPSISNLTSNGIIAPAKRGLWDGVQTLAAMVRKLRERNEQAGSDDRARKNKSEADTAELDAMKAAGQTCAMADAKQFWSDARIEIRQTIERADFLTGVQKTKLLTKLAALRTKQPEKEQ